MTATKTRSSGGLQWLCAFVFCCSVAAAGHLRAQDTLPGSSAEDTAPAAASDQVATGVNGVASQTSDNIAPSQLNDNSAPGQAALPPATTVPAERDVSERTIFLNVLHDQKDLWLFPVTQLPHGHHWVPVVVVTGVTAGLVALDPHDDPYFRRTQSFSTF